MKAVQIIISFNISEKDYNSSDFQQVIKDVKSGELEEQFASGNKYETKDFKVDIKTK